MGSQLIGHYFDVRDKPDLDPITEFKSALAEGIVTINISSVSSCKQPFELTLEKDEIKKFLAGTKFVDEIGISGHSGPILEAKMHIVTAKRTLEYNVSVNQYEPEELFLRRVLVSRDREGRSREWEYREIRVPKMGKWLFGVAPNAAL